MRLKACHPCYQHTLQHVSPTVKVDSFEKPGRGINPTKLSYGLRKALLLCGAHLNSVLIAVSGHRPPTWASLVSQNRPNIPVWNFAKIYYHAIYHARPSLTSIGTVWRWIRGRLSGDGGRDMNTMCAYNVWSPLSVFPSSFQCVFSLHSLVYLSSFLTLCWCHQRY